MGQYQFLKSPEIDCDNWRFSYSKKGWTSQSLVLAWIQHFHEMMKGSIKAVEYRMLIVDGHVPHIRIEFIEFCFTVYIIDYFLPPHFTHLLQPLDVGLFFALQKAYGKQVDHLVQFGNVTINKGNFLPMVVAACKTTSTPKNILGAQPGSGLVPHNLRHILDKLTLELEITTKAPQPDPVEPPTSCNTAEIYRKVQQATLQLRSQDSELSRAELLDLIHQLEKFAIVVDQDCALEDVTFLQWKEAQNLNTKRDQLQLGRGGGTVMDGKFLKQLYEEQEEAEQKKREKREKQANQSTQVGSRKKPGPHTPKQKGGKGKRVSFASLSAFESGLENIGWSGDELEGWESEDDIVSIGSSSSILSTITLATPGPACSNIPHTPPSPTPGPLRTLFKASGCRVTRSRTSRRQPKI